MPLRAPNRTMNAAVGRMIFGGGATKKTIAHSLNAVPQEKWKAALQKQGLHDMSVDKLSHALSGQDRAGLSQHEMKRVVTALQETGVASKVQGAGKMVLTAAREAQQQHGEQAPVNPVELKQRMKRLAQERRKEANTEEEEKEGEEVLSVLDRMRTANARVNKHAAEADGEAPTAAGKTAETGLTLAPKIVVPKPENPGEPPVFFQA